MRADSKDFSAVKGRRLRIAFFVYVPSSRSFRYIKGKAARITVENVAEQDRLWKAIEGAIEAGEWKDGKHADSTPDAEPVALGG